MCLEKSTVGTDKLQSKKKKKIKLIHTHRNEEKSTEALEGH